MLNTTARAKAAAAIIEATTTNTTTTNTNINNNRASFSSASDFSSSRRKQTTWEDENGVTTAESTNIKDGVSSSNKSGIRDFTSIEKDRSLWTQDNQGVVCTDDTTGLQTENNTLTLIDSMESVEVEYVPSSSLVMSQSMDAAAAVPSFDVVPSGSELRPPPIIGMDFSKLLLLGEQAVATEEESLLEAAYKNSSLTDPPEIELVKLGATLKKDRRHITDWFKQRKISVRFLKNLIIFPFLLVIFY